MVGVFLPVSAAHIAAVLAVLRAGRIYLSLDPAYPEARLRAMVAGAGVTRIISLRELAGRAAQFGLPVIVDGAKVAGDMAAVPPGPESFAALYFTSGSTGAPKIVTHTHRNVLFDIGRQTRDMGITIADRFDLLFSPSFSAFLSPVFGALLTGASVHVFDLKRNTVEALRDFLAKRQITVSTASVTTFRRLVSVLAPGRNLPQLRMLSLGAEPLRLSDVEHFRTRLSTRCVLQNALATTETRTIAQSYLRADEPAPAEVCVGFPVAGKALRLLDEHGRPVAPGETGEIAIQSVFISPGPWDELHALPGGRLPAPRQTEHRTGDLGRFTADGQLVHLGRKDDQMKVRGHRIEAAEVEGPLLKHPAVRDAAVFATPAGNSGHDMLIGLWVRREGNDAPRMDLREYLRGCLPDYMVPNQVMEVPALPLTETGKLARRRLKDLWLGQTQNTPTGGSSDSPRADDPLRACWQRVLGVPTIGEDDDFFALGGDSMAATELMAAVAQMQGRELPAGCLLTSPTLRTFRRCLQNSVPPAVTDSVQRVPLHAGKGPGRRPLYLLPPWNHDAWIFRDLAHCDGEREIWVIEGFDRHAPGGSTAASIAEIADRVAPALQRWHPDGEFDLGGYSMGGFVAWEAARRIKAAIGGTQRVYLLDCSRYYAKRGPREEAWVARTQSKPRRLIMGLAYLLWPRGVPRWPILYGMYLAQLHWSLWGRWLDKPRAKPRGPDPYERAFAVNVQLSREFPVERYSGPVTLIRAHWQPDWHGLLSADLGWRELCPGGLEIVHVPADHANLLRDPMAARLAACLNS